MWFHKEQVMEVVETGVKSDYDSMLLRQRSSQCCQTSKRYQNLLSTPRRAPADRKWRGQSV